MASQFKPGDIVQLKSGGPSMTISVGTDIYGNCRCVWFKGATREEASFKEEVLTLYKPPQKP